MLLPRAWPRFVLLRLVLAARGRLPWHFLRFLADARRRQLLRQSAGTYQFRHIRLQERLASRSLARDRAPVPRDLVTRRRRRQLAVTGSVVAATCLLLGQLMPEDTSRTTLPTGDTTAMAFGPPGTNALVTVDGEGAVRRWDTRTGEATGKDELSAEWADGVASGEEGAVIYQVTYRQTEFGSEKTEVVTRRLPWHGSPQLTRADRMPVAGEQDAVGMSTSGRHLLLSNSRGLALQRIGTGRTSPTTLGGVLERDANWSTAVGDNGRLVISMRPVISGAVKIIVADTRTGERICEIPHDGDRVAMDSDGSRFATADDDGGTVRIWDAGCQEERKLSIPGHDPVDTIALSGNGRQLAVSGAGVIRLFDL